MTLASLISRMPSGIAQGILYGIMALGVYLTFRILKVSDLTVDGSFATGGAVCVMLLARNVHPLPALVCSALAGMLCGTVTGLLYSKLSIPVILSSILCQIGLYSINLRIMDHSALQSINILQTRLLLTSRNIPSAILAGGLIAGLLIGLLYWFFGTELGCAIRACGNSSAMARSNGIDTKAIAILDLALANGLVGLAGGLIAQYQGFADVSMGRGAIVTALAAIIIGEALGRLLFHKPVSFWIRLLSVIAGGIIYYLAMVFILWLKIDANDLKLFTAIIVAVFLALGNIGKGEMINADN